MIDFLWKEQLGDTMDYHINIMCDFRLLPWSEWDLWSSGILPPLLYTA